MSDARMISANRTNVELKSVFVTSPGDFFSCANRTNVELK